jgi:hypothetical protein
LFSLFFLDDRGWFLGGVFSVRLVGNHDFFPAVAVSGRVIVFNIAPYMAEMTDTYLLLLPQEDVGLV